MMNRLYKFWTGSITRQLMMGIALVHAVLMTVFVFDLVDRQREFMLENSREGAVGLANTLATNGSSWILSNDFIGIEEVVKSQAHFPGLLYAMFLDLNGRVLGFTDRTKVGQYIEDPISLQLLQATQTVQFLVNSSYLVDVAVPVNVNDQQIGWARVGLSRSEMHDSLQLVTINGIIYTAIAIAAGLLFAWFMARRMTLDIRTLEENANLVWQGNFDVDFILDRSDEIGKLSHHFDRMVKKREGELSKTHQKLALSEELFRHLYEKAPLPYQSLDNKGCILVVNEAWLDVLGYSKEEVIGYSFAKFLLPEFQEHFEYYFPRFREKGEILGVEFEMVKKDGSAILTSYNGKIAYDEQGNFIQTHCIFRDITEQRRTENELATAHKEWEKTFNAISDIITIQDKKMHIVRANKAAYQFFNKEPESLVGKSCYQILRGITEPCQGCPLPKTVSDKGNYSEIIKHERLGKIFQVSSSSILDEKGEIQYLVHIARDITEQKKQEQLLLKISVQQEQLKRLESLKTMAGAIAHRFNNTMMAVQGNLELILYSLPDYLEEKKMATAALEAASEASIIGSMMLSYVGQRPLQLQVLSLSDLVIQSTTTLKSQLGPSISLKCIPPPEPLYCSIDQQQIKEVINNLITNAIESINDEAGEIEISFGSDRFETTSFPVAFQGNSTGNRMYTFCQVRDTGQGIIPENIQRIFEPFFTTKFVGRGFGLALSEGIIRSHHGAILVESTPGVGTIFKILLPAIDSFEKKIEAPAETKWDAVKLSGDILLADDDDIVRDIGRKMLEALGLTVHIAVNGLEAVEMVCGQEIDYRAVVLDISMPEMDGIEAMKEIRKYNADLPILLSSGYAEEDFVFEKDLARKADGFLQKPFQLSDLQNSLKKILS